MSDLDHGSDPLATAFSTFRDEAPRELEPPGPVAARRTVRRRRAGTAVTALGVIVVLVIGFVRMGGHHVDTVQPAGPPRLPVTVLPLPRTDAGDAGARALDALADVTAGGASARAAFYGAAYGTFTRHSGGMEQTIAGTTPRPGTYEIDLVCYGQGTVRVSWEGGSRVVRCGDAENGGPYPVAAPFPIPSPALSYQVETAVGTIGLAYVVTDPSISRGRLDQLAGDAESAAIDAYRKSGLKATDSAHLIDAYTIMMDDMQTGPQYAVVVCQGSGTARVDLLTDVDRRMTIPCDGVAYVIDYVQPAGGVLSLTVTPDMAAFGRSAAAFAMNAQPDRP
jgi:hypothetical protein